MTDDRDPEATLDEWKAEMQAEHQDAIEQPDPDEDHRIEGVAQISYRLYYEYDSDSDDLERVQTIKVDELDDPELRSCSCGVRGMTPQEALVHVRTAATQS